MATFNSQVTRAKSAALMPEDVTKEIMGELPGSSVVMNYGLRLKPATRNQMRIPVWENLPMAYFVDGDTGLKQTTDFSWKNIYANIVDLACIVPIPEAVLEDSDYDIWGEAKPSIIEAFGQIIDLACLFNVGKPSVWDFTAILPGCVAAGNVVDYSVHTGAGGDFYSATLGENGTIAMVENDGLRVTGHVAALSVKSKIRGLRGSDGHPVFVPNPGQNGPDMLAGAPIITPTNGGFVPASALMISGDWKKIAYTVRKDFTYKILTEASIYDNTGALVYALAQQDMVALRVNMRMGVAIANPPNRVNEDEDTRYPWAALVP